MKDFFNNKVVKVVCWVVLALVSAVLILGGITPVEIGKGVELVGGIVTAIGVLIIFISGKTKKE